jgi:hypothetical protein
MKKREMPEPFPGQRSVVDEILLRWSIAGEQQQRRCLEEERDRDFAKEIRAWMKERIRTAQREARDHSRFRRKAKP